MYTQVEKLRLWNILCTSLAENDTLRRCWLKYITKSFYFEHMETLQRIIDILRKKENLRQLSIQMSGYSAGNLENFRSLDCLDLATPIVVEEMVECLKSNPSLSSIVLHSPEIIGRLADIAPFCKNIRFLGIQIRPHSNAIEYAPFTQLPNLRHLRLFGSQETDSMGALFKSMAENGARTLTSLTVDKPIETEIESLSKILHLKNLVCELKDTPLDLSSKLSWQLPVICALYFNTNSKDDKKDHIDVDILPCSGMLGLTSENMILIRKILLRLNSWSQSRRRHSNSSPMWFEINDIRNTIEILRGRNISDYKNITKIASFALLKALENQWPTHARNIHLLARIRDLEWLRVKVKLNIEGELKRWKESDIRCHVDEFKKEIPIDSDTREIIFLAILTYLTDTLVRSKGTRIRSDIVLRNFAMEIIFDIRL